MTRRARGPCLPRARVMVWVRSARNPNPLAVTTLSPHPYSHINSVRWGWFFFLMGGKTETRPPESHVFDSQKTPIFTMLGLGSPLPWGPTLASVPRDSPSKKLTAPHGVDRLFFCLTERGNSHRPKGWTLAGLKEGRGSVPPYGSQAALLHWGTYPPSKQAGRLTRAKLHLRSRDPRLPPTGSRVGGTDRPPQPEGVEGAPVHRCRLGGGSGHEWGTASRMGPHPSRTATGTSEELVPNTQGAVGPSGPSFMGERGSPRHKQMP